MKRIRRSLAVAGAVGALALTQVVHAVPSTGAGKALLLDSGRHVAPNGQVFTYEKMTVDGQDVSRYRLDGKEYSEQQLRAYEAANPTPVIDESLLQAARTAGAKQPMDVVVWLRNRPGVKIARELRQAREAETQALEERARQIQRSVRPMGPLSAEEEQQFVAELRFGHELLSAEQKSELKKIGAQIESMKKEIRAELDRRVTAASAQDRAQLEQRLAALGGRVRGRISTQNAYEVTVLAGNLSALAGDPSVARIIALPPAKLELDNQATSLGLTTGFWSNAVEGGIWDVGVLDTGVQQNHPSLTHMTYLSNSGTTDADGHGTGVAGIIASDNATYRGMAFGMEQMLVGTNSSGSVMSHADWMVSTAADDAEVINLSSGYGTADDVDYSSFDQFWDGLIDDNSVLVTKSAGNGGVGNDTDPTITHPAPAYNLLAVANVYDNDTSTRTDDLIRSTSSRGPTLNGRKKPDIAAPGHNTMTTNNAWAGAGADFVNFTGTSAAAPHVAGGAVLLTDLRSSDNPAANKAILLNTADAWTDNGTSGDTTDDGAVSGSEWNKTYGWGYMDLWEAWYNGLDVFTSTVDDGVTPAGPDFKLYKGYMFANEKATLVWNRHLAYNGSGYPTMMEDLSDLDLIIYNATSGASMGSSASVANNVEQVAVAAAGDVVVKVDVFGSLDPDLSTESFALATEENFVQAVAPTFAFAGAPGSAKCGSLFTISATVTNNGTVSSFNNNVTITLPSSISLAGGAATQNVGTITAGGNKVASWVVTSSLCLVPTVRTVTFTNSSASYGESFTGTANHAISFIP